ncbi:Alpha-ketoglutarate-dependent dioxygenase alkB-like protein 3 [Heterocephalus glaber]|uniref:Alpha-ketoglutarate-dependent dioxygenase alkB-like protein 3 n=1 Tax=Heterocephalus glaber TaxID=10181 RepID=G5AS40_HETGA|nr:Alpha-ketoglutarate-dependent dioxygenase alkB-like protein 3 [Heterocephalus glaber]
MADKRQQARVQGAWAAPKKQPAAQPGKNLWAVAAGSHQTPGQTWRNKEHHLSDREFVFKEPQQWHPVLRTLKHRIEENTGHTFNSLLCNLYRNEKDSVDWHSDDEPALGRWPVIASLSFGATRTFEMRKKPQPTDGPKAPSERMLQLDQQRKIPLDHGALLVMEGATQADWQHRVPKEYHSRELRVNLTFRTVYPDPGEAPR